MSQNKNNTKHGTDSVPCFNKLSENDKIGYSIKNICLKYQLTSIHRQKLLKYVNNLVTSNIYQEIKNADEKHVEFGYSREDTTGRIINGIIDLVYRNAGRWKILDYKTNSLEKKSAKKVIKDHEYDIQLAEYAQAVENAINEQVTEKILFFADTGECIRV